MIRFTLLTVALSCLSIASLAKADELLLNGLRAKITVPKDWRTSENLLGSEWSLLSPMVEGKRISLQLNTLENDPKAISEEKFLKVSSRFKEGRLKWARARKLEALEFKDPQNLKREGIDRAVRYEWSYRFGEHAFSEVSEYIFCRTGIYHLKAVIPEKVKQESSESDQQARKTFGSFRCG